MFRLLLVLFLSIVAGTEVFGLGEETFDSTACTIPTCPAMRSPPD